MLEYDSVFASKKFIKCYKLAGRKVVPVTAASFPGPGPDGEAPPPGVPARDEAGAAADGAGFTRVPDDGWDADADMARTLAACEAGLIAIPGDPDEPGGPGGMGITAGTVVDPADLMAFGRSGGLAGSGQQAFTQGGTAGVLPAGPLLTILAEQAVTGEPGPPGLAPGGPGAAAMAGDAMAGAGAGEAAAAAASRAAGAGPLAGIPGGGGRGRGTGTVR
jgi:hypothetical protein